MLKIYKNLSIAYFVSILLISLGISIENMSFALCMFGFGILMYVLVVSIIYYLNYEIDKTKNKR